MKTKKFNLFDVLIVIIVAVIIAGIIFRVEIRNMFFSDEDSNFIMDVQVTFLENGRASLIKEGGEIFDADGKSLGTVTSVSTTPSKDIVTIDGIDREVLSTRCKDVTIEISLRGYISDGVYYTINGSQLVLNDSITLETASLSLNCRIVDVRKVAATEE